MKNENDIVFRPILNYLEMVEGPNRQRVIDYFNQNLEVFEKAPGSRGAHQAWPGGYLDHLEQTMIWAEFTYSPTEVINHAPLDFSLSDAILVLFLHDLEKPFKYVNGEAFADDQAKFEFIQRQCFLAKIALNQNHLNALKYIHGEGKDYTPGKRIMGNLAVFCHNCDFQSAGIWKDVGKRKPKEF
jgi:hypothetical protein